MIGAIATVIVMIAAVIVHVVTDGYVVNADRAPVTPAVLGVQTQREQASPRQDPSSVHAAPLRAIPAPRRVSTVPRLALPSAHAAAVIDAGSGVLLFEQNAHERRQIASLTKLFTAYIVRSSGVAMDAPVTIRPDALIAEGSRVGCKSTTVCTGTRLVSGEVLTVQDLLTAMLVSSANDAAVALAQYISGSSEAFVRLMNIRAREAGLTDTRFCSPNGLETDHPQQECFSTAADMARIGVLALNDRFIWSRLNTRQATIVSVDGRYTHELIATNELAQSDAVPGMLGAKTGYTSRAGKSLILAAAHPDDATRRIVAVLLGDPRRWEDIRLLVPWIYRAYRWE